MKSASTVQAKDRRIFLLALPAAGASLMGLRSVAAQPARVEEGDPAAVALGYKHDATQVDTKKYPQYKAGNICANCALYAGKPTDPWAPCSPLGGKLVNAKGWCVAWVKKA